MQPLRCWGARRAVSQAMRSSTAYAPLRNRATALLVHLGGLRSGPPGNLGGAIQQGRGSGDLWGHGTAVSAAAGSYWRRDVGLPGPDGRCARAVSDNAPHAPGAARARQQRGQCSAWRRALTVWAPALPLAAMGAAARGRWAVKAEPAAWAARWDRACDIFAAAVWNGVVPKAGPRAGRARFGLAAGPGPGQSRMRKCLWDRGNLSLFRATQAFPTPTKRP